MKVKIKRARLIMIINSPIVEPVIGKNRTLNCLYAKSINSEFMIVIYHDFLLLLGTRGFEKSRIHEAVKRLC